MIFRTLLSFLTFTTFFFVSPAQAEYCQGKYCVGSWVMDRSDNVGQISGFPEPTVARYKVGGYSYDTALTSLSLETNQINGVSPNTKVVDASDNVGVASRTFEDGRIQYVVGGYNYVSKNIEPEVTEFNFVRSGLSVIDASDNVGTASVVFRDGRVQYVVGGYKYVSKRVVSEIAEINGIQSGTIVIDRSDNVGKANKAFRDGRIHYQVGGYNYVSSNVTPETTNVGLISKGTVVVDASDNLGVAENVFTDGRVRYVVGGYFYVSKQVKAKVSVYDGIQEKNLVLDASDNLGTVTHAFEDGRFAYVVGGYRYVSKRLSPEVSEINGFKAGMTVLDRSDNVGTIAHVFRDGRMRYSVGGYHYVSKTLYKETETHPTYSKDTFYATTGWGVGKPIRFFENERVQVALLKGVNVIVAKLFLKTDTVGGFAEGLKIVDSSDREGVVKMLFENGTLSYDITKSDIKREVGLVGVAKIYGFFNETDKAILERLKKDDLRVWLLTIAGKLERQQSQESEEDSEVQWEAVLYRRVATTEDKLPEIRKALLDHLFENPELIQSKELRKKVRDFLSQHNPR